MKNSIVLIPGVFIFLCSCTLMPQYTQPEVPIPTNWPIGVAYDDAKSSLEAPFASELPWREYFTDERLQEIIQTALYNNRDLRVAALNVEKARAMYGIQRAELLPVLNAVGQGGKERVPADFSSTMRATTVEQYSANLGVSSWEIDFFGRIRSLEKKALEEFFATEQARRSTQILLVSEVANAYLTLAADRGNLNLAQSTYEAQLSTYDMIRRRHEVGLASELDLRQVQTRVDAAQVDIALYTRLAAQDENALNLLVGSPVPTRLLPEDVSTVSPPREISAGVSSLVLLNRPDILQAEHLLKASNANIGAARAAFFPRISLTAAVGTASNDLSGLFKSGSGTWSYTPQVILPIFDARLWSALDASEVERKIVLAQYEKAIQTAFAETADALAMWGTVESQLSAQKSLVFAQSETYRLSYARYTKGTDNYLGVLDAQRSLYSSQQGLVSLRQAKLANQVRLYAVLGGGA